MAAVSAQAVRLGVAVVRSEKGRKVLAFVIAIPILLVILILSSPYAIFFSLTENDVEVATVMNELFIEFQSKVNLELSDKNYDECNLIILGSEDNTIINNSTDVMCIFSTIHYNTENADQVVILDDDDISELSSTYWYMNDYDIEIKEEVRTITVTKYDDMGEPYEVEEEQVYKIKNVIVDSKTALEVAEEFNYSKVQTDVLVEMLGTKNNYFMSEYVPISTLTPQELDEIKKMLPANISLQREKVVTTALSLVGKVPYFWGGKSSYLGFDPKWNTQQLVTAGGSSTTNTYQPYGLDCSGFIAWTFVNVGLDPSTIGTTIGHGTSNQFAKSIEISRAEALPGDLVFIAVPNTVKVNHVGIVVSSNNGEIMVVHENGKYNNVSLTTAEEFKFIYFRRPVCLMNE